MLSSSSRSGRLPIERSERAAATILGVAAVAQLVLGLYRAREEGSSPAPAIAFAVLILGIGIVWFARRRSLPGASLARPLALLFATYGALSAVSAFNAPLISVVDRVSAPLFAFAAAAVLVFADAGPRTQAVTSACFALALTMLELSLS